MQLSNLIDVHSLYSLSYLANHKHADYHLCLCSSMIKFTNMFIYNFSYNF